jgi:hypothetical protein
MAQDAFYSIFDFNRFIPDVIVNENTTELQKSLYPNIYNTRSVIGDINWIKENDSSLYDFWSEQGDTVLHILTELSGIRWREQYFDIYFVRQFQSFGSSEPLIIPIGSINNGTTNIAASDGARLKFNLIYQVSRRMLSQLQKTENNVPHPLSFHPLLRPGPYRFDNMALLLAYSASLDILGLDSTMSSINSAFWKNSFPGLQIFRKHFEKKWILTPNKTLVNWLSNESYNSDLVRLTRPPRPNLSQTSVEQQPYIEGLPLKGQLGFSTYINSKNQLVIQDVDPNRLASANGLKSGDIIRRINGRLARNHKLMVQYILEGLSLAGSIIEINREGKIMEIIIRPIDMPQYEQEQQLQVYPIN